ncbi:DsbA family protein [Spirillospora albida]|uniref:DsbA family protein n=1 Tax=Spirillospora albida TaxID=58123 RepID=UPI00068A0595|nr:thioredoxin domain-containing protein [Spirillospora albida]
MGNPPNSPWPQQPGPGYPYGPPMPPPPRRGPGVLIAVLAGVGFTVLLLAVAAFAVFAMRDGGDGGGGEGPPARAGQIAGGAEAVPNPDGSLTMARPGVTAPLVEIYEDFACPHCGAFDRMHDPMLKELAVSGRAKVIFRPMVVFAATRQPAHGNALRAAAAMRCVGDGARWLSYQDALYAHQPPSLDVEGYTTSELVSYGAGFGLTGDDFGECVRSQRHAASVLEVSRRYLADGLQGTPAARVNGRLLTQSETASAEALRRAIEAAG